MVMQTPANLPIVRFGPMWVFSILKVARGVEPSAISEKTPPASVGA
jgi:hypothetical protein